MRKNNKRNAKINKIKTFAVRRKKVLEKTYEKLYFKADGIVF